MSNQSGGVAPQHTRFTALMHGIRSDHRYVLLGTSVIACLGMWLSSQARSTWSFLAPVYALEVGMYYTLFAFVVFSAGALIAKLLHWKDYATTSWFVSPRAKKFERIASYVVVVLTVILALDRIVMGFGSIVAASLNAQTNPDGFLPSAVYMVFQGRAIFARGIVTTIELAVFGTVIAFFLAILLVFVRIQQIDRPDNDFVRFLKVVGVGFAKLYSAVVRGTPMMVQSLLIYFAGFAVLSSTGMSTGEIGAIWSTFIAGLVTISLNSTAYMMEVLRGGIEAVDAGQNEAARSLGLSQWQAMTRVVFPQGIKNAIPALSNELVVNIKDSSVLSVIGVFDLMFATTTVAGIYYRQLAVYAVATVCYLILTMIASKLLSMLAHHLEVASPGPVLSTSDMTHTHGVAGAKADPAKVAVHKPHKVAQAAAKPASWAASTDAAHIADATHPNTSTKR
ncbi:MAG: amino acid ABC transporter permease [Atopobium sp.]|uniref:amino acid ABC transporter permease n=1 Tax=Atopobium sp. TaxID=1872650 RepID=UPI002A756519|nr:amino acid ABC transporter permease [Atopobium sp.]MDY2788748.1 amino acid ABC transporter permease [Atopobium sp.]